MFRTGRRRWLIAAVAAGVGAAVAMGQVPASAASTVTINGGTTYQRIDGFGISESFNMANAIRTASSATQKRALDLLFSTSNGAGFTIVRNDIPNGSDSIEPRSPGSPSATPSYVWNASNGGTEDGQLWLALQAKNNYGVTNFYNNAWNPPAFMTNSSDRGGLCGVPGVSCGSGDWRQAYANYLVQDAKFWASAGITPSTLGFVNEPSTGSGFGSMLFTPAQAANFISVLGPTLKASGLSTKVTCCDTLGFNQLPSYVSAVSGNSAANAATGVFTSHGYSGAPTSPISSGGRPVWESEWSINGNQWDGSWDDGNQADGFIWAQNAYTALAKANVNAFFYFWGVSTTSHDSSLIGLSGGNLNPAKRYYALANYSRFIRPGATRISASGAPGGLDVAAFKNTDGSVIITALNTGSGTASTSFSLTGTGISSGTATSYLTNGSNNIAAQGGIAVNGGAFSASVPGRSLVTYRIAP